MITKGIVEERITNYKYKVRIPMFDSIEGTNNAVDNKDLSEALVCTIAGSDNVVNVGDVVYVAFEDNDIGKPVIIGQLFTKNKSNTKLKLNLDSLAVDQAARLSTDTQIGDIPYKQLDNTVVYAENLKSSLEKGIGDNSLHQVGSVNIKASDYTGLSPTQAREWLVNVKSLEFEPQLDQYSDADIRAGDADDVLLTIGKSIGDRSVSSAHSNAISDDAYSIGFGNYVDGRESMAVGTMNVITGEHSSAVGLANKASYYNDHLIGTGLVAHNPNSVVVGTHNADSTVVNYVEFQTIADRSSGSGILIPVGSTKRLSTTTIEFGTVTGASTIYCTLNIIEEGNSYQRSVNISAGPKITVSFGPMSSRPYTTKSISLTKTTDGSATIQVKKVTNVYTDGTQVDLDLSKTESYNAESLNINYANSLFTVGGGITDNSRTNNFVVYDDGTLAFPNFDSTGNRIGMVRTKFINGVLTTL